MTEYLLPEEAAPFILRLAFALAIGFLIGLERGWRQREERSGDRLAGIRTYALYGLLGGAGGVLPNVWALPAAILGGALLIVVGYLGSLKRPEPDRGTTSETAAIITIVLGGLAGTGQLVLAAAGAVLTVLVLDSKRPLHAFLNAVRGEEVNAAIKLLVISVLILPFLPDQGYGPGGVLNPYEIWWAVVVVAGLSFAGYVAIRALGSIDGPLVFGLIGGLASSTAVTVASARMARSDRTLASAFAGGIGAASAVMMSRVAVLLAIFAPALMAAAWPPLAAGALASLAIGLGFTLSGRRRAGGAADALTLPPPDDVWFAVIFGFMLALIGLGIFYAERFLGDAGLFVLAVLSGVFDVDAFTLSAARSAVSATAPDAIRDALLVAVAVNTVGKAVIAWSIGGSAIGWRVAAMSAASVVAGAAVWALS